MLSVDFLKIDKPRSGHLLSLGDDRFVLTIALETRESSFTSGLRIQYALLHFRLRCCKPIAIGFSSICLGCSVLLHATKQKLRRLAAPMANGIYLRIEARLLRFGLRSQ